MIGTNTILSNVNITFISNAQRGFVLIGAPSSPSNTLGHNVLSVDMRNMYGTMYLINFLKLKFIQVLETVALARDQYITALISMSRVEASRCTYDEIINTEGLRILPQYRSNNQSQGSQAQVHLC